ncbi:MAG: NAD(P)-binding domain-containing protein [Acidobacteriota bacterium]
MLHRYYRWLHGRWPAGRVEKLPLVREDGSTHVPGLGVVGDLKGIPLLKFAVDSGSKAVQQAAASLPEGQRGGEVLDLVIIGAGVSGMAAAVEARKQGLSFEILEASEAFSTIVNFPKGKPIFTYPTEMTPSGEVQVGADVKEDLLAELRSQTEGIETRTARALAARRKGDRFEVELAGDESLSCRRVVVALGRSGNFRKLGVPGEELPKVYNRLHDPQDFCSTRSLVVGGGDSAVETAIALTQCGGDVTLIYRGKELSRPKPENLERLAALQESGDADVDVDEPSSERVTTAAGPFLGPGRHAGKLTVLTSTSPVSITEDEVTIKGPDGEQTLENDVVFSMIGRQPPLDFFRQSGVHVQGEWRPGTFVGLGLFMTVATLYYSFKNDWPVPFKSFLGKGSPDGPYFPFNLPQLFSDLMAPEAASTLGGVILRSAQYTGFWATLIYSLVIVIFGIIRIRRRKTPYVTVQTTVLMLVQVFPLFLLPEILLPWMDKQGWLPTAVMDALFPAVGYGNGREYWRAYGFILAFPLNVYNVFTPQPMPWWLVISAIQTFVLIPAAIYYWGKGVYCGWLCSCGAMAETMGDQHRHAMPHGPWSNRLNMLGQAILVLAFVLLGLRIVGWVQGHDSMAAQLHASLFAGFYAHAVDILLAGVLGVGLYFWFSGRTWCRFACPLAALMHVYARFSRFAIIPEKKKCISCNACTATCHQGIDIMNFANKGVPMQDPQCVRCSACVQACPTGTLTFGQVDSAGATISYDSLVASAVQAMEKKAS